MIAPIESHDVYRPSTQEVDDAIAELQARGLIGPGTAASGIRPKLSRLVNEHPGGAVAIAAVVGLAVGWYVKRRLFK